jgi:hypothetical protein
MLFVKNLFFFWIVIQLTFNAALVLAQERPFLYTVTIPNSLDSLGIIHFDAGWGDGDGGVALMRVISGWKTPGWRLDGNVVLEKANSPDRDPLDLIVSMGWLHRVTGSFSAGIETVGQDLEGFWEPNEAEGGARILLGPSLHFHDKEWEAGLAGGYVFWPTLNDRVSPAERPFGSSRWALQLSFAHSL